MNAARRATRLRWLLYTIGAVACICRYAFLVIQLPSEAGAPPMPQVTTGRICALPPIPSEPVIADARGPFARYPYWNVADQSAAMDSHRCTCYCVHRCAYIAPDITLASPLPSLLPQLVRAWMDDMI